MLLPSAVQYIDTEMSQKKDIFKKDAKSLCATQQENKQSYN